MVSYPTCALICPIISKSEAHTEEFYIYYFLKHVNTTLKYFQQTIVENFNWNLN